MNRLWAAMFRILTQLSRFSNCVNVLSAEHFAPLVDEWNQSIQRFSINLIERRTSGNEVITRKNHSRR